MGARPRARPPRAVITLGRGSSDHAATFARYLIETRLNVMTASAPPSVSSILRRPSLACGGHAACLVISQVSPAAALDILAAADGAKRAGALVVALVNDAASPLAELADVTVPLLAGPELSVAATKSYIGALSAIVQLAAAWRGDALLAGQLSRLPALLERAWALDWSAALAPLAAAQSLYVLGRGIGFGIAEEAALKLKETCGLHAEAFSAAEVIHGPMALVGPGFPVLAFAQGDETREGSRRRRRPRRRPARRCSRPAARRSAGDPAAERDRLLGGRADRLCAVVLPPGRRTGPRPEAWIPTARAASTK